MLPILVLCLVGAQHPQAAATAKAPGSSWTPSSTPPLVLAAQVDSAMHSLSNTVFAYRFAFVTAIGRGALFNACAIAGPKMFHIEYPVIGTVERDGVKRVTVVANGSKMGRKVQDKPVQAIPFGPYKLLPGDLVKDWFKGCVGDLFSSVGTRLNPVTMLVSQASRPGSGYVVRAEKRRVFLMGQPNDNDRIVIERTPAGAAKEGSLFYEIVVDSKHYLPISLTNTIHIGKIMYTVDLDQSHWRRFKKDLSAKVFDTKHID